jgi:hypothetical protein
MKCKYTPASTEFNPVSVTITFETQAELDAFGRFTNCAPILDTFRKLGGDLPKYTEMRYLGADINDTEGLIKILMNTPYMLHKYRPI